MQGAVVRALLRNALGGPLAMATNWSLTLLRSGHDLRLTREEMRFTRISFAQFGEDLAVVKWVRALGDVPPFYIDVGCFHPIFVSNTLLLHKQGWRGINIDIDAAKIALFDEMRPDDINVVAACSDSETDVHAFSYGGGVTNRIGPPGQTLKSVVGETPDDIRPMRTTTLNAILAGLAEPVRRIGYLNIDCEGSDLQVLKGFDLARYRPPIVTIEGFFPADEIAIRDHMTAAGYEHKETFDRTFLYIANGARR
jgi:hypothetical protein